MSFEISIIVPSYRRSQTLHKLVKLLVPLETHVKFELLVVDQNLDEIRQLNQTYLAGFSFVRFVKLDQPNVSAARNLGAKLATSDVLLFLDDDIEPTPDFVLAGLSHLRNHPEIEFLVPLIEEKGKTPYIFNCPPDGYIDNFINERIQQIREAGSLAIFVKRSSFLKSGGFDVPLFQFAKTAEDQEYFYRLAFQDFKLWVHHDLTVFHNDKAAGGCELRTKPRSETRAKCVKSWFLRRRIHARLAGKLRISDWYRLVRSCMLNREALLSGNLLGELKLFLESAKLSDQVYQQNRDEYLNFPKLNWINYLTQQENL